MSNQEIRATVTAVIPEFHQVLALGENDNAYTAVTKFIPDLNLDEYKVGDKVILVVTPVGSMSRVIKIQHI